MGHDTSCTLGLESVIATAAESARCGEILDALPLAVYATDAQGRLTQFNRAAAALAGRAPQLGVDTWCVTWKLYRPDGTRLPHDQCPMAIAIREGRALRGERAIAERPDGTRFWFEAYPTPTFDGGGNLTGAINVLVDVTERKRAEDVAGENQRDLAEDLEAIELLQRVSMHLARAEDCQALYDRIMDAAVAIMRSEFASMQMYYPERGSKGEMRLLAFRGFDPDAARFWEWVRADSGCTCGQALRTGKRGLATDVETCDFMAGTPDRAAYLEAGMRAAQSTPLFSRGGKLVGMISTHWKHPHQPSERDLRLFDVLARQAADWMERLQAEEALRRNAEALDAAREQAEHANRAKDRFLAVLSHELRTPLSPVVMTVAAMETDPELPYAMREDVAMIRRNIELEVRLIDDLLDLSRVTSGKMRLQVQPASVHPILRQAVQNCASETSAKRLDVRLDLRAERDLVEADPARLQQVFWNLIRNAAKFTPEGGQIVIRTASTDGTLRIEVQDTGVGIPPEHLPKVFDAFEQGDIKTGRQFGGLGLGLAICKAVVDMHGGTIAARSDGAGRGATFTVELSATVAGTESPRAAQPSGREGADGNPRILLVEDHPDTANVLSRLLRGSGYHVTAAGSVATALKLAGAQPFDLVVSDLGLPDGTGYELMQQIRERHGIKGIALSGYGMEEDQRQSREAGFIDHVVKPVDVAQLEAVIRRVAGGKVGG